MADTIVYKNINHVAMWQLSHENYYPINTTCSWPYGSLNCHYKFIQNIIRSFLNNS